MHQLLPARRAEDLLPRLRGTPVGLLLEYHNLQRPHGVHERAELLVGMCMDNRNVLRLPDNFAYMLRTGGANLRRHEFKISFAVAVGGVRALALVGHTDCGMVGLSGKRDRFVRGLVENAGWTAEAAAAHFDHLAPEFEIPDAASFVLSEARRLAARYPRLLVAPLLFQVEDRLLYQIQDRDSH